MEERRIIPAPIHTGKNPAPGAPSFPGGSLIPCQMRKDPSIKLRIAETRSDFIPAIFSPEPE